MDWGCKAPPCFSFPRAFRKCLATLVLQYNTRGFNFPLYHDDYVAVATTDLVVASVVCAVLGAVYVHVGLDPRQDRPRTRSWSRQHREP